MKARWLILAFLTLAEGAHPSLSSAQTIDAISVRTFIERNGELLDVAAGLVQETNSTKARGSLETARTLHAQSIVLLEQDRLGMAARVAFRTREVIQQTIAIAKREARLEEQALKAIERAAARLEQARTAFEDARSNDSVVRRLLLDATDNLRRAREQLQQHTFEVSLRLAESSASLSRRALQLLRHDLAGSDVQDEIDRTEHVLERLSDVRATLPPPLSSLADRAVATQARARMAAADGNIGMAREQTLAARNLALRALRIASDGEASPEGAERAVAVTDEILERARELAQRGGGRGAVERLGEAERIQGAARRSLEGLEFERALAQTMRAREMVRDALAATGERVDPAAVETALARTDDLLARLQRTLDDHDDAQAREMSRRAQDRQEEARRALADGDARRALALTKVANSIAREGLRRLGDAAF